MPPLLLASILGDIAQWVAVILVIAFLVCIWNDGETSWGGWRKP